MASPPKLKNLNLDDYPDAEGWWETFVDNMNPFLAELHEAFDKNLTIEENLPGSLEEKSFTTGASVAANVQPFPLYISQPRNLTKVRAVSVVAASVPGVDDTAFTTALFPSWRQAADGRVKINFITGLSVSTPYRLTFRLE